MMNLRCIFIGLLFAIHSFGQKKAFEVFFDFNQSIPNEKSITLYTLNRHPKDILRSYAHEMIHHKQNLEGKLTDIEGHNINEDDYLKELEREAYEYGNGMYFRGWENSL